MQIIMKSKTTTQLRILDHQSGIVVDHINLSGELVRRETPRNIRLLKVICYCHAEHTKDATALRFAQDLVNLLEVTHDYWWPPDAKGLKTKVGQLEEAAQDLLIAVMEDPRIDAHTANQVTAMKAIKELVS